MRLGRGARPVVICVFEAVQRGGEHVVKLIKITRLHQGLAVEQTGVLGQFAQRFGPHGVDEHAGVHQPVKATANRLAAGCQIQWRADAGHGTDDSACVIAHFFSPTHQRVAAQRDTHCHNRPDMFAAQPSQDPVDFLKVARVVSAWPPVQLAAATAKMRHRKRHSMRLGVVCKGFGVVTAGGALQPVELHQQGLLFSNWSLIKEVDIDKVGIWRCPPFASEFWLGLPRSAGIQRAPDSLQVAAGQPPG